MLFTERIRRKYGNTITGIHDLIGDDAPSPLFYLSSGCFRYMLTKDAEALITQRSVSCRKRAHYLIQKLGPHFLKSKQIFENRNRLLDPLSENVPTDPGITLPKEPMIWISNHAFKDDVLASILAARRHAVILFGSLPQFYNTFDGITAWLNGVVLINRKIRESAQASIGKCIRAMSFGADLLIYPEGVWNKTPHIPILNLYSGVYHIARETGAKVVPIVHYIRDETGREKDNPIHTVIDDPIQIDDLTEKEALERIRDKLASWYYLMMEQYGQSTWQEELGNAQNSIEAWGIHLKNRVKTAARYDREIELCADYRPKEIIRPEDVFAPIAAVQEQNIIAQNVKMILAARELVKERKNSDFQRLY